MKFCVKWTAILGLFYLVFPLCEGGCNWPTVFQSTTWLDNTRGSIVWSSTTATGWSFTSYSSLVANWECLDTQYFASEGILLLKATDTFEYLDGTWVSYMCLVFTRVTEFSYYYYQQGSQQINAANERVTINQGDTLTTKAEICNTGITVPAAEFHFMVKSGSQSSAKQYCPPSLLAKMDYDYKESDGTTTHCDASTDNWDVCTDRMVMTFDYSTCSQQIAYSSVGVVWCMANITSGYEYVVVYNTDESATYQFSCFVVSTDGTSASMVYKNCTENQTPTKLAKTHNGAAIGATLNMTATETCPFVGATTTAPAAGASTSSSEGTDLTPIIVGVVVGILVLAVIAAVTIYCIKRKKANVEPEKEPAPAGDPVVTNGNADHIVINDLTAPEPVPVAENPALTANPVPNTLSPIPANNLSPRKPNTLPPIGNGKIS